MRAAPSARERRRDSALGSTDTNATFSRVRHPEAHDSDDERGGARGGRTATPGLPLSAVRKIVLIDEDIKRVTPAALHLVNRATDLFLRVSFCDPSAEP